MTTRHRAAIYARISQARRGDELGVSRQLKDCRAEAARRGWIVAEEYVDDDISAYSGKVRPAYERMLEHIATGERDAVLVWHLDRLHRRPVELEHFVATCTLAGVSEVVTLHGDIDLAKGDGLLMARLLAAVAANESDNKRRRIQRKTLEVAESGEPWPGGPRPYGFQADFKTLEPSEAGFIREVAERVLAGESLQSVVRWLDDQGAVTTKGNQWKPSTIRAVLLAPRYWGMRVHHGQIIGPAVWEPILTPDQGERLRLLLTDPSRKISRPARRYLLSGMLRCGKCGGTLYSAPKAGKRGYSCIKGPELRGCGGIYIHAEKLEALIADAVLLRLDTPLLATHTERAPDSAEIASVGDEVATDQGRLDALADMWSDGEISREEWKRSRARIEQRMVSNRRRLSQLTGRDAVEPYVGQGEELRATWDALNLSRQVAIVKAVIEHVEILPVAVRGRPYLDPNRVRPVWRL